MPLDKPSRRTCRPRIASCDVFAGFGGRYVAAPVDVLKAFQLNGDRRREDDGVSCGRPLLWPVVHDEIIGVSARVLPEPTRLFDASRDLFTFI